MSTESILKPVIEIKGDEAAQRLLDVLNGPVSEITRPSTDIVRGLDGFSNSIEHALVANNFVIAIGGQMVAGQGRVFERVRYHAGWWIGRKNVLRYIHLPKLIAKKLKNILRKL